jgi:thiazole/oxazole-forming peptide maturase SagC family component
MGKAIVGILGNEGPEFHRGSGTARPIVLLTDSAYGRQCARQLANDLGLPLEIVSEDVQKSLRSIDLTSRLDAVAQGRLIERFKPYFAQCAAVLGSFVDPDIPLLRNLNRLLVELEKPLVLGLIDGPFLTVISTKPPQTGCFECFEHRILARLEDSQAYEAYVSAQRGAEGSGDATSHSDALTAHLLTTAVLAEGVLYATLGMSRLAGRCASIYRPLLEVQMQDLLRVPYCPACGNISRLKMRELYVSSRAIVKHLLSGVELDKSE